MSLLCFFLLAALPGTPVTRNPLLMPAPDLLAFGISPDPRNVDRLIDALRQPDPRISDAAWTALWAIPRVWTPEQLSAILRWIPSVPEAMAPRVAERFSTLVATLVLLRRDLGQAAFSPAEISAVQSLYSTASGPLLQSLLLSDRLLREVPIPQGLFMRWLALPEPLSIEALRVASDRMDGDALVSLLDAGWKQAGLAWRLQCVQLSSSAPAYLAWLRPHAVGLDDVAKRAETTLQLHSANAQERKATIEIIGKSADPGVMSILLSAMKDRDPAVASAALSTFWENPRPYTAEIMEDMLQLAPAVSVPMQRTIVENLPVIVSMIAQERGPLHLSPLSQADLRIIQALFTSDDPRILRNLLTNYFFFGGVTLSANQLRHWIAMPDPVSVKALPLAPRWLDPASFVTALDERWKTAGPVWQLQAVQISWGDPLYRAWLERHLEPGEIGEMARLTLVTLAGFTPQKLAEARSELKTPPALHRWAQLVPALGRLGSPIALAELRPDGILTADFVQTWPNFGIPVPPPIAAALMSDRRMIVRSFAAQFVRDPGPREAKAWCGSEYYDVRAVGARFAERETVEDLLVDDRPEVRLAAIIRWAGENWPDLAKTLRYGLSDPLLTDNLLLATVGLPQCQPILAAWGASEPQRSKLNSAKSILHPPGPVPLPIPVR